MRIGDVERLEAACAARDLPVPREELAELETLVEIYANGLQTMRDALAAHKGDLMPLPGFSSGAVGVPAPAPNAASTRHEPSRTPDAVRELTERVARQVAAGDEPTNAFVAAWDDEAPTAREGPLAGLVFGVKDNIHVAGRATTCGAFSSDNDIAVDRDAPLVAALREAGAVCTSKLNLGEYAIVLHSARFGEVRNPWNLERSAGGSSGGSAAAVAARAVDVSLGTDSAGSVRLPAAMCGVVGFRPTTGSLSHDGIDGPAWSVDGYGVFARSVSIVRDVMGALDWKVRPFAATRSSRLAVLGSDSLRGVAHDVARCYASALAALERAGFELLEVSLSDFALVPLATAAIAYCEVGAQHADRIRSRPDEYGRDARNLMRLSQLFDAVDYVDLQRYRLLLRGRFVEMMHDVAALLTPTIPTTAPPYGGGDVAAPEDDAGLALFALVRFTALANLFLLPSISLPSAVTPDGLPVGLQLTGSSFADLALLQLAARVEDVLGFDVQPPQ